MLRHIGAVVIFLSGLLSSTTKAHSLEEITFYSEEFFPYNYTENLQVTGFSVELLGLVFKQLGSPPPEVKIVPWKRGYTLLEKLDYTALFSTIKTEQRFPLFHWACPINRSSANLYVLSDSQLSVQNLADLSAYKIAVLKDQAIEAYLHKAGLQFSAVPTKSVEQSFKLLALRRVDMIALVSEYLDDHPRSFKPIYQLFEKEYCFAFNSSLSTKELNRFQQALAQVRLSQDYSDLYTKYFE
ncbi:substrate-binding periplasmic protein [Agarivorans sp. MS3-6]|uniref:substrate-binding periplasmic protein n=1 Tax=Agarivorans sp. TSD2052 TaxID=2937286 RepID=UPI00200D539C|nr:transporter substrate-binding domain-containing protein [Agarivorans sp. TSD2052]UPW19924.1 transporter substrate-binding domain-containing protein [Agarivorans sp. TSD2052]